MCQIIYLEIIPMFATASWAAPMNFIGAFFSFIISKKDTYHNANSLTQLHYLPDTNFLNHPYGNKTAGVVNNAN